MEYKAQAKRKSPGFQDLKQNSNTEIDDYPENLFDILSAITKDHDLTQLPNLHALFTKRCKFPPEMIRESEILPTLVSIVTSEGEVGYTASRIALQILAISPMILPSMASDILSTGIVTLVNDILAGPVTRYASETFTAIQCLLEYTGIPSVFFTVFSIETITGAALKCLGGMANNEIAQCLTTIAEKVPLRNDSAAQIMWVFHVILAQVVATGTTKTELSVWCLRGICQILETDGITLEEKRQLLLDASVPALIRPFLVPGALSKAQVLATGVVGKMYSLGISEVLGIDDLLFLLNSEFLRYYRAQMLASLVEVVQNMEESEWMRVSLERVWETLMGIGADGDYGSKVMVWKCVMAIVQRNGVRVMEHVSPQLLDVFFEIVCVGDDVLALKMLEFLEDVIDKSVALSLTGIVEGIEVAMKENWEEIMEQIEDSQGSGKVVTVARRIMARFEPK